MPKLYCYQWQQGQIDHACFILLHWLSHWHTWLYNYKSRPPACLSCLKSGWQEDDINCVTKLAALDHSFLQYSTNKSIFYVWCVFTSLLNCIDSDRVLAAGEAGSEITRRILSPIHIKFLPFRHEMIIFKWIRLQGNIVLLTCTIISNTASNFDKTNVCRSSISIVKYAMLTTWTLPEYRSWNGQWGHELEMGLVCSLRISFWRITVAEFILVVGGDTWCTVVLLRDTWWGVPVAPHNGSLFIQ